jgi:hypothetical protein
MNEKGSMDETGYRVVVRDPMSGGGGREFVFEAGPNDAGADTFLILNTGSNDIALYIGIDWEKRSLNLSHRVNGQWSGERREPLDLDGGGPRIGLRIRQGAVDISVNRAQPFAIPLPQGADDVISIGASGCWRMPMAEGRNVSFFCLVHEGRCGSTVLASLIDQHPAIAHFNEILTRGSWISQDFPGSPWEARRESLDIRLDALPAFVQWLATSRRAMEKPADHLHVGFEIKMYQILQLGTDLPGFARSIESSLPGVRFLFLTRRNILRRHVSNLRCLYKDVSHARDLAAVNFEKVRIAPETMRDYSYDYARRHDQLAELLEASSARQERVRSFAAAGGHLHLEYEDFETDPLLGARKILNALGLPHIDVKSPLLKTGDRPLSDLLENYDEVRTALEPTRWRDMLD